MKKFILFLSFLLFAYSNLFASYSIDWIKPADNNQKQGAMIARNKSDNLIVTGYIQANNIFTRKYDKFGNLLWTKTSSTGISGNYEKTRWVNCDKNKNVYVIGREVKTISSKNLLSENNQITVEVSELKAGIYFCKIKSNQNLQSVKLIKE